VINLARHVTDDGVIREVTQQATAELEEAGIKPLTVPILLLGREVPAKVIGSLCGWTFERAWTYWIAKGPGLPVEIADRLHETYGREVRVDGHCGAPSPREWFHGFGVGHYHVDSQAGLGALAKALMSVAEMRPGPAESAASPARIRETAAALVEPLDGEDLADAIRALPEAQTAGGWHYLPELPPEPAEGEEIWLDIWRHYPHKPELRPIRDEVPWRGDAIDGPQFRFRYGFATYCWRRAQHEPPPIPAREGQE